MPLTLSDLNGARFQAALELLDEGKSFTYEGFTIWVAADGALECTVSSSWNIQGVTEHTSQQDFDRADCVLAELLAHPEFAKRVAGRAVRMILALDYGNGSVELCKREDGRITWTGVRPEGSR